MRICFIQRIGFKKFKDIFLVSKISKKKTLINCCSQTTLYYTVKFFGGFHVQDMNDDAFAKLYVT